MATSLKRLRVEASDAESFIFHKIPNPNFTESLQPLRGKLVAVETLFLTARPPFVNHMELSAAVHACPNATTVKLNIGCEPTLWDGSDTETMHSQVREILCVLRAVARLPCLNRLEIFQAGLSQESARWHRGWAPRMVLGESRTLRLGGTWVYNGIIAFQQLFPNITGLGLYGNLDENCRASVRIPSPSRHCLAKSTSNIPSLTVIDDF